MYHYNDVSSTTNNFHNIKCLIYSEIKIHLIGRVFTSVQILPITNCFCNNNHFKTFILKSDIKDFRYPTLK